MTISSVLGVNKQAEARSGDEFPCPKVQGMEQVTERGTSVCSHSGGDGGQRVHDVRSP